MSGIESFVSPAGMLPGNERVPSACGLSVHWLTSMVTCRRHLPTCKTRGTAEPTGTFSSLKEPSTPVVVLTTAPLGKSAAQLHLALPVGTPAGSACSGAAGTYTAMS